MHYLIIRPGYCNKHSFHKKNHIYDQLYDLNKAFKSRQLFTDCYKRHCKNCEMEIQVKE